MNITTKFDIGQEVWLIHENKVVKEKVEYIRLSFYNNGCVDIDIYYDLGYGYDGASDSDDYKIKSVLESRIFATKEELIKSL